MRPASSAPFRRLARRALPLLLGAAVLAAYWPALHGALLWDDPAHVTRPDLQSWHGLLRIWTDVRATQQFYPVLHSAFWIEHRLWGDATIGYHLVNVLWHALACVLFAFTLRRLWAPVGAASSTESPPPVRARIPAGTEWIAAIVFALHPLSVESVAWISEQKNTLSLVFYLLAALAYLRFDDRRRRRDYAFASVGFVLAVGTKSVTATLPAALLVVIWWRRGRITWARDVRPLAPWLVFALLAGLFTAWVERKLIGAEGAAFSLTLFERTVLAARIVWFYAGKLLWPAHQAFFYERWDVAHSAAAWIGWLAGAIVATGLLWWLRRRARGLFAGWLLFVGALFPALGFFNVYPFVFSYVADHFQYLASLAFIGTLTGAVAAALTAATMPWRRAVLGLAFVLTALLLVLARKQAALYGNDEALFRATIAASPDSWMAHHILGFALTRQGRHDEAIAEYRTAIRLNPNYPDAHLALGLELAQRPDGAEEALGEYRRTLELKPGSAEAHNNLGLLLAALPARRDEAIAHYETALRLKPDYAEAHANLANILAGDATHAAEADEHYRAALRLAPASPEMHDDHGRFLLRQPGRTADAAVEFQTALRLRPDFAAAHAGLGQAWADTPGRLDDAIAEFTTSLRLDPAQPETQVNLGNALMKRTGAVAEAIEHYDAALRLDPDLASAHANRGAALGTMSGRESDAIAEFETALRLQPDVAWVHLALALQLTDLPARAGEALAHAERALQLQPDYAEAHNCLGILHAQAGRLDLAAAEWQAAVRLKPDYENARDNLRRLEQITRRRGGP